MGLTWARMTFGRRGVVLVVVWVLITLSCLFLRSRGKTVTSVVPKPKTFKEQRRADTAKVVLQFYKKHAAWLGGSEKEDTTSLHTKFKSFKTAHEV